MASPTHIRTALGDIAPEQLGACSAHEHVVIDDPHVSEHWPGFDLSDVDEAAAELELFKASGGGAVVDCMAAGCGRNPVKSAEASRRSGVHVVLATGIHLAKYYRPNHWLLDLNFAALVDFFAADIREGIAETDDRPGAPRTEHRAGVIKIAGGRNKLDDFQIKIFEAAAEASRRTGCPIITHTEQGTAALEQARRLIDGGADPAHVILSHVDRVTDLEMHRQVLATGVHVEYDAAFRWKERQPNPTVELIVELAPDFPRQITVGMDLARRSYKAALGGAPRQAWLMTELPARLSARGLNEAQVRSIWVDNPARAFAFTPSIDATSTQNTSGVCA